MDNARKKFKQHSEHYDAEHYANCSYDALMASLMLGRLSANQDDQLVARDCLNELRRRKFGEEALKEKE